MTSGPALGRAEQLGAWLFRHRGWLPVPLLIGMVLTAARYPVPGLVLVSLGESLRLWAVGHIGLPSRTREQGAHRVVDTGPYALVRNPLYVGNIVIFAGLGVMTWPWLLGVVPALALHYHFIVRWEEANLRARLGSEYVGYCARVGRWLPSPAARIAGGWDPREALRSERSTLLAIGLVLGAMAARSAWAS